MSKRKCPNCGATVSEDMKYCRKCHAKLDTGRVEVLKPSRRAREDEDALRNLPRPVRPAEDTQPTSRGDGFFEPEQSGPAKTSEGEVYAARPDQTAKGGSQYQPPRRSGRNLWQIAAVLAVILVIIIVAIVLVIKLNKQPEGTPSQSEPFEGVHVIENATPSPAPSAEPTVSPEPANTPGEPVTIVDLASPPPVESSPSPSPSADPYNVTTMNDTVYITGNGVNIRSGPGTSYSILGNEMSGYELQRTGRTDDGWSRVNYKGSVGYVSNSLISSTKPAQSTDFNVTSASGTVTVASAANLRTGPGQNYSVDSVAQAGTKLTRTGVSGTWTRVQYNGKELFIATGLVTDDSDSGSGGSGTTTTSSGTVTGNGVRVRKGPGTTYDVIGYMNTGDTVTIEGEESGWYKITYNGQTGYISADYVKKS